ncbi:MAG TPA: hypothetical protein VJS68_02035, partial [Thermoplasmata archaeon]|nr:hypothetical protein [Thermoplasmata archaeon]
MKGIGVLLNTQTPLVRFKSTAAIRWKPNSPPQDLAQFREGTDFEFCPGGVTRMVYPMAHRLVERGDWKNPHW